MGNLLSMVKTVSREASGGTRGVLPRRLPPPTTRSSTDRGALRMALIYYVYDDLAPVAGLLPSLISRRGKNKRDERSSRFS